MVGLEKNNQDGGQLKETKLRWISSMEICNVELIGIFLGKMQMFW